MNKIKFLLVCMLFSGFLSAQSVTPEVVASSGAHMESSEAQLSFTVGECITETFSSTNNQLTQGFQQSKYTVVDISEKSLSDLSISVYPNPSTDYINIDISNEDNKSFNVELYDMSGRIVKSDEISSNNKINMQDLSSAEYILKVFDSKNNLLKTFKIVKSN
jgi:hypothetical protein